MSTIASDARRNALWLILVLVVWPLISMAMDVGEYLDDAWGYFDKGEYRAAVIQLKNALLADPDNGKARLLLGKTYFKLEGGPSAVTVPLKLEGSDEAREGLRQALALQAGYPAAQLVLGRFDIAGKHFDAISYD